MSKDPYKILEIKNDATETDIKKAYRKKALELHPDKNPDDPDAEEKFKEATEAYEILRDPVKKNRYDRGKDVKWDGDADFAHYSDIFSNFGGLDLSDLFDMAFGRSYQGRGRDYTVQLQITLREAYFGTSRRLDIDGKIVDIKIKRGIHDGQRVTMRGMGEEGSIKNGDLKITVFVLPEDKIIRQGDDLYIEKEIDLFTAILGGTIEVDTFEGKLIVSVPKGMQEGHFLRVSGRGMPVYTMSDGSGDLFIKSRIIIPTKLTEEQEKLFEQIQIREINKNKK